MVREKLGQIRSFGVNCHRCSNFILSVLSNFNMANALAEGGVAGVTLIAHALYGINPAYSSLILNVPLFILGARIFWTKIASTNHLWHCFDVMVHLVLATCADSDCSRK